VLECYERAWEWWEQGIRVVCMDEKPNLQALERAGPGYPMRPGWIERQELESIRHGTVHRLVGLRCGPSVWRPMTVPIFERPCFGIGPGGGGMSAST
jgi:hypothetical protein